MFSHASKHEEKQIHSRCERAFEKLVRSVKHFCRVFAIMHNICISLTEERILYLTGLGENLAQPWAHFLTHKDSFCLTKWLFIWHLINLPFSPSKPFWWAAVRAFCYYFILNTMWGISVYIVSHACNRRQSLPWATGSVIQKQLV